MNLKTTLISNIDIDIALPRGQTAWLAFGGTRLLLITSFSFLGGVSAAVVGLSLAIASLALPRSYTFVIGHFVAAPFIPELSAGALVILEAGLAPLLVIDSLNRMPEDWRLAVSIQMLGFAMGIVLVLWLAPPVGPIVESAAALAACVALVLILTDRYLQVVVTDFESETQTQNGSEADE